MTTADTTEHAQTRTGVAGVAPDDPAHIAGELKRARERTLALLDLPEEVQLAQISPLMSPMVWDLAHIGNYEELWLLREIDGRAPVDAVLDDLYNAFEHPRWARPDLPVLGPSAARDYDERVRADVLDLLAELDLTSSGRPDRRSRLLADGFVYGMVIQHEHQHDETLLATHQLRLGDAAAPPG
jgi:iron(II)-dependent oxidoreductase